MKINWKHTTDGYQCVNLHKTKHLEAGETGITVVNPDRFITSFLKNTRVDSESTLEDCVIFGGDIRQSRLKESHLIFGEVLESSVTRCTFSHLKARNSQLQTSTGSHLIAHGSSVIECQASGKIEASMTKGCELLAASVNNCTITNSRFSSIDASLSYIQSTTSGYGEVHSSNLRDVKARSVHSTRSELHKMSFEVARFTDCKLQGEVSGSNFVGLKCSKPVRMVSASHAMSWYNIRGLDVSAVMTAKGWIVHTFDFEGSLTAFATYCKRRNLAGLAEMVAYFTFKE